MALPVALSDSHRGLPPDQDRPPVRLYIASGLCRDPKHEESLDAFVEYTKTATQPVPPTSLGTGRHVSGFRRFLTVAQSNMGLEMFHISGLEIVDANPLISGSHKRS